MAAPDQKLEAGATGLSQLLERLEKAEIALIDLTEKDRAAVGEAVAAVEALNKAAFTSLIRSLKSNPALAEALKEAAADDVVYTVLRRHGILKPSLHEQVEAALEGIRPMLADHGGDVELVAVTDGVAEVRFLGACDGCPASLMTFYSGVAKAVQDNVPGILDVKQVKGAGGGVGADAADHLISPFAPETHHLLDPEGPGVILGWSEGALAEPLSPSASSLFGPRGLCLAADGSLWVADTGHHRLLGWKQVPTKDNQPADIVIGQDDFGKEGRNGKVTPHVASLNVPTGVTAWGDGIAVADAWNHRILIWRTVPQTHNQPADTILGQSNSTDCEANRGNDKPDAATMHWPYGVAAVNGALVVCDSGNRRVLIFNDPQETGQAADLVLGQNDFTCRDENAGGEVSAMSMRWSHGAAAWGDGLAIADAGNNRVMVWNGMPSENGAVCDRVLGQGDPMACDHNRGGYDPAANCLNMPYALASSDDGLIIADTANSRLLGWAQGDEANRVSGQPDFTSKGDNRWKMPARDSLCWPYGLAVRGSTVAIADSGNNRVLLWECAS